MHKHSDLFTPFVHLRFTHSCNVFSPPHNLKFKVFVTICLYDHFILTFQNQVLDSWNIFGELTRVKNPEFRFGSQMFVLKNWILHMPSDNSRKNCVYELDSRILLWGREFSGSKRRIGTYDLDFSKDLWFQKSGPYISWKKRKTRTYLFERF